MTTVAVVLALAGLVAVASHGTPVWSLLRDGPADRLEILGTIAPLWGLGIIVAVAIALVAHRTIIAHRPGAPPLRTTLLRALPITAVALAVLSLLAIARADLGRGDEIGEGPLRAGESSDRSARILEVVGWFESKVRAGEGVSDPDEPGGTGPDPGAGLPPALIVAIAVVATAAAGATTWWWYATRSARPGQPGDAGEAGPAAADPSALHGVVVGTIDEMVVDPDPNTAIIGAYARILEDLAARGAGRRDPEAPMEHLHRVLAIRDVRPEPLRQLIELFELARFSTHPLNASHREQALDALRAVAADLAAHSASAQHPTGPPTVGAER